MSVERQAHIQLGKSVPAGENTHLVGKEANFLDMDYSVSPPTLLSMHIIEAVWVENASGGALLPGEIGDWKSSNYYKQITGKAGALDVAAGVVDPFLPSAGVADGRFFWLIRRGPCKIINAGNSALTEGLMLVTAASGRVDIQDTSAADEMAEVNGTFGRAMETIASTAGTKGRAYVNFP